jgi:neutral amino acid transport system permease protein
MVGYLVSLVIFTAIYALFSLGLNLQWGFTGLINFGYVAFMAIGAYATVLLSLMGVPLLVAAPIGGVLAAILGLLIGFSTLRLREDYLAIVTIGVSEVVRLIALNEEWLTRGAFGIQNYPLPLQALTRPNLPSRIGMIAILAVIMVLAYWQWWKWLRQQLKARSLSAWSTRLTILSTLAFAAFGIWVFVICAIALFNFADNPTRNGLMLVSIIVVAITYWALERLVRSPWGRVLKAIREDEVVARALGKNVFWYKLQSLMIGGFIGGIAGALYAWQLPVYPENFAPLITFNAWTIVVLGGAGNNPGTILGAVIFWAYTSLTRFLDQDQALPLDSARLGALRIMLIGLLLMVLMMWRPQGLLGRKEELTLGR